jgi:DNA-binding transcriptional LysR family regulator
MDIQQLRHFLATVRYGNLGVAAQTLHITVSGLSRSIKALEESVGLPLFTRTARGVEPTSHAMGLVPWAQSIVNQRDRALEEFRNLRQARSGVLRFGITINFARDLASRIVGELLGRSPGIEVTVSAGAQTELIERLQAAELDFVFGTIRQRPDGTDLTYDPIQLSRSGVFCRPDHPYTRLANLDVAKLSRADWALVDSHSSREAFHEYFASRALPVPRLALCSNSLECLIETVRRSDLLTNLPERLLAREVAAGTFAQLHCEPPTGHATVAFVQRTSHVTTPAMLLAMELIRGFADDLYPNDPGNAQPAMQATASRVPST